MNKLLLALGLTTAIFSVNAKEEAMLETVFADSTTLHSPGIAKQVVTYKGVKAFHSKGYPMLVIPLEDYDGKSELTVTVRAARDNSQPANLGVICQVQDKKTKKMLSNNMNIRSMTEQFTDYHFKLNPGKLVPGTSQFRILFYAVGKKGNIYLEKIKVESAKK